MTSHAVPPVDGAAAHIIYIEARSSCSDALAPARTDAAVNAGAAPRSTVLRGHGWERIFPTWFQLFPPQTVIWRESDVPVAGLNRALDGLRILHLSDFHFRCRYQGVWEALSGRLQ